MKEGKKSVSFKDLLQSIAIAVILALLIKTFVFQFYYIPSGSMEPTLQIDDKILVTKYSYKLKTPERGEIIVFEYPYDKKLSYIKRLIGLPGEQIEIKDSELYINDILVQEKYLPEGLTFEDYGPVEVPEDQYFMLGDNRNHSSDSRVWGFVDKELIVGKARLTYWPLDRIGGVN